MASGRKGQLSSGDMKTFLARLYVVLLLTISIAVGVANIAKRNNILRRLGALGLIKLTSEDQSIR